MKYRSQNDHHSCGSLAIYNYLVYLGFNKAFTLKQISKAIKLKQKGSFIEDINEFLQSKLTQPVSKRQIINHLFVKQKPIIVGYMCTKSLGHFIFIQPFSSDKAIVINEWVPSTGKYPTKTKISVEYLDKFFKIKPHYTDAILL